MIDVLKKLQEITDKSPEVAKAVENVKATNPKEVKENAVESEPAITEYKVGSYKDFLASKGIDIYKLKGDEHSKYAQLYKAEKERAHADATTHKGTDDHREISRIMKHEDEPTKEGGMSDVHIGAQEKVGEFIDADGNLSAPKQDVLQSLEQQRASAPFPESYEIETAIKMVQDDFDDNGQANAEYEPDPEDSIPHDVDTQMNMDAPAEEPKIEYPVDDELELGFRVQTTIGENDFGFSIFRGNDRSPSLVAINYIDIQGEKPQMIPQTYQLLYLLQ